MSSGDMKNVSATQIIKLIYENNWTYKCVLALLCHPRPVFLEVISILYYLREKERARCR